WSLWWAASVSQVGDGLRVTALPLLAATLSRDALSVSLVTAAVWLPWLCFGLSAGATVDRSDRRALLGRVQVVRAVARAGFVADAASFAVSARLVQRLPGGSPPRSEPPAATPLWADVREGLGWLWSHYLLRFLALAASLANAAYAAFGAVLVLYALEELHLA